MPLRVGQMSGAGIGNGGRGQDISCPSPPVVVPAHRYLSKPLVLRGSEVVGGGGLGCRAGLLRIRWWVRRRRGRRGGSWQLFGRARGRRWWWWGRSGAGGGRPP